MCKINQWLILAKNPTLQKEHMTYEETTQPTNLMLLT
jgi:hypothetical protein